MCRAGSVRVSHARGHIIKLFSRRDCFYGVRAFADWATICRNANTPLYNIHVYNVLYIFGGINFEDIIFVIRLASRNIGNNKILANDKKNHYNTARAYKELAYLHKYIYIRNVINVYTIIYTRIYCIYIEGNCASQNELLF